MLLWPVLAPALLPKWLRNYVWDWSECGAALSDIQRELERCVEEYPNAESDSSMGKAELWRKMSAGHYWCFGREQDSLGAKA